MRRSLAVFLCLSSLAVARSAASPPGEVTLRGYVVDAMCGRAMAGKAKGMQQAAAHTRACALDAECAASGYGVFTEGGWYVFDARGDSLAAAVLSASARAKGILCEVTGTPKGGGN